MVTIGLLERPGTSSQSWWRLFLLVCDERRELWIHVFEGCTQATAYIKYKGYSVIVPLLLAKKTERAFGAIILRF